MYIFMSNETGPYCGEGGGAAEGGTIAGSFALRYSCESNIFITLINNKEKQILTGILMVPFTLHGKLAEYLTSKLNIIMKLLYMTLYTLKCQGADSHGVSPIKVIGEIIKQEAAKDTSNLGIFWG